MKAAFTLIEILVVAAIIAILIGISVGAYGSFVRQARDSKRKADLQLIRNALEQYKSQNGIYPQTGELNMSCSTINAFTDAAVGSTSTNTYLSQIPHDPKCPATQYAYQQMSNTAYIVGARIESAPSINNQCTTPLICGSNACNYCITQNQ